MIHFIRHIVVWFLLPRKNAWCDVHANLTSQILSAAIDGRPLINSGMNI